METAGAWADVLLDKRASSIADPRDVALVHETVLGVLRRRAVLDHVIASAATRASDRIEPAVLVALRIGSYALLFLDRVPEYAAVDTAVDLVKRGGARGAAAFVNAVLRRVAREGRALLPPRPRTGDAGALALVSSHPDWWVERLVARLGWAEAASVLDADNEPAPTVIRACLRRVTARDLAARLAEDGVATAPADFATGCLRVTNGDPARARAFREGLFWFQDEAAVLSATLLGPVVGPRALDACAAPGGKTMVLADALVEGGVVVAADRHAGRLRRLEVSRRRLGADAVAPVAVDLLTPAFARTFDQVLVDAPCSGTGTMRRHPEIRWRLNADDPARLAIRQGRLLDAAAELVRPEGCLVYAVCSMEPEEGSAVVARFLDRRPGYRLDDPAEILPASARRFVGPDLAVRTSPADAGLDGFFAVRLSRRA